MAYYGRLSLKVISWNCNTPLEPVDIIQWFAPENLPLQLEIENANAKCYNRLAKEFHFEFCDEEGRINWERVTRYISDLDCGDDEEIGEC